VCVLRAISLHLISFLFDLEFQTSAMLFLVTWSLYGAALVWAAFAFVAIKRHMKIEDVWTRIARPMINTVIVPTGPSAQHHTALRRVAQHAQSILRVSSYYVRCCCS
jgi:hypothetical protein